MIWMRPWCLLLLVPWLAVMLWLWRRQRRSGGWSRLVEPDMLSALRHEPARRRQRTVWGALVLAGGLIVVALAGPARPMAGGTTLTQGSLVVVLDNSLSMAVEDVTPSRQVRARRTVLDWAGSGPFHRTAVIAYSGSAHWLTPFTRDVATLTLQLNQLDPFIMPQFGNRPDLAFAAVDEKQRQLAGQRLHLLWLTDDATPARLEAIAGHLNHGGRTWIMPIGSRGGGPIPLPNGQGFLNDGDRMVVPTLDRGAFEQAASRLDAQLVPLGSLPTPEWLGEAERDALDARSMREWGYWLLLPAMALLLPWYRRGLVFLVPLAVLVTPPPAQAEDWPDRLLNNREQRAYQALQQGEPERSQALTRRPEVAAAAAFAREDYETAVEHWSRLDDADAHYNRGNALVRLGELEAALEAYQSAIDRSGHERARQNRERVEAFLEQQEPESSASEDAEDEPGSGPSSDEPSSSRSEPEGDAGTGDNDSPRTEQEGSDGGPQAESPETDSDDNRRTPEERMREQAVEQLLNRVRTPPATLLQRKFEYEFQQDPTEQDESQLW